ncbi:MAG: hypothetical protein H6697_12690 [Myxococcales bacterium]|nr:hypothetical protein [Myxococcales bacterium]
MHYPASTGSVADHLGVTEPQINDLIRRRKLADPPPVVAGRRQWLAAHVAQVAELLRIAIPAGSGPRGANGAPTDAEP